MDWTLKSPKTHSLWERMVYFYKQSRWLAKLVSNCESLKTLAPKYSHVSPSDEKGLLRRYTVVIHIHCVLPYTKRHCVLTPKPNGTSMCASITHTLMCSPLLCSLSHEEYNHVWLQQAPENMIKSRNSMNKGCMSLVAEQGYTAARGNTIL